MSKIKYYQNKTTGEIIGVENMRVLITHPKNTTESYTHQTIYDMICPNKILGNGFQTYCIEYSFLHQNYIAIKRTVALEKYPKFKQYRHNDIPDVSMNKRFEILNSQSF